MQDQLVYRLAPHGAFLLGRDLGATVRDGLRLRVNREPSPPRLAVSFNGVEAMTFSFADEFLGRLYTELAAGDLQAQTVVLCGLGAETREAADLCLERRRLLALDADTMSLIGDAEVLHETFTAARRLGGGFTPQELARALAIAPTAANNRLKRLVEAGTVHRTPTAVRCGGRVYLYTVALGAAAGVGELREVER